MIVHQPVVRTDRDEVCLFSRVRVMGRDMVLWFRFPCRYKDYVTGRTDPFAALLLPLAMLLGEDMEIRGEISPRLAYGLKEYQRIQELWQPGDFQTIDISAQAYAEYPPKIGAGAVGAAFSGGVDSFHTLLTHLPETEPNPGYRISHCLMINGFDGDANIGQANGFSAYDAVYRPMLAKLGVELIICRTNFRHFLDAYIIKKAFGAVITACALALGPLFSTFFIPSSYRFSYFFPDGSHLLLDPTLSTESTEILHDGSRFTRVEKTVDLARYPETYRCLRVCFMPTEVEAETKRVINCGRCAKCLRTMATLDIAGALSRYEVFAVPLNRADLGRMDCSYQGLKIFADEIMKLAWEKRRTDVVLHLAASYGRGLAKGMKTRLFRPVIDTVRKLGGREMNG